MAEKRTRKMGLCASLGSFVVFLSLVLCLFLDVVDSVSKWRCERSGGKHLFYDAERNQCYLLCGFRGDTYFWADVESGWCSQEGGRVCREGAWIRWVGFEGSWKKGISNKKKRKKTLWVRDPGMRFTIAGPERLIVDDLGLAALAG